MADSGAVRQQRYWRHRQGDHSICRHGRHDPAPRLAVVPVADDTPVDPRASLDALARRLEAAHEQQPDNANLAKALLATLLALSAGDPDAGFDCG